MFYALERFLVGVYKPAIKDILYDSTNKLKKLKTSYFCLILGLTGDTFDWEDEEVECVSHFLFLNRKFYYQRCLFLTVSYISHQLSLADWVKKRKIIMGICVPTITNRFVTTFSFLLDFIFTCTYLHIKLSGICLKDNIINIFIWKIYFKILHLYKWSRFYTFAWCRILFLGWERETGYVTEWYILCVYCNIVAVVLQW